MARGNKVLKRPAADFIKKTVCVSDRPCKSKVDAKTTESSSQCACGSHPRILRSLYFGKTGQIHCQKCYTKWRDGGVNPVASRVHFRTPTSPVKMTSESTFFVPRFFDRSEGIAQSLFEEMKACSALETWDVLHGALHAHLKHPNPEGSCTFARIVHRLSEAFHLQVDASRINVYRPEDWKPLHHDKHVYNTACDKKIFTVAAAFGATREIVFAHPMTGTAVAYTLEDGDVYAFGPAVNQVFMHGVAKARESCEESGRLRLSVVVWGSLKD